MKSIHLICRRDQNNRLNGLARDPIRTNVYHSSCWAISKDDADALIGGWIYLHPAKPKPSEMGGRIIEVHPMKREGNAIEDGFVFVFEAKQEGKNQKWRGANHVMAWTSGVINATLSHET